MVRVTPNPAKVYVGNLPSDLHKDELKRVLGKYGNLRKVWLAHNPPGFAFCDFYNAREARVCVRELNGRRVFGSTLRVEISTGDEPPRRKTVEIGRCGSTSSNESDRDSPSTFFKDYDIREERPDSYDRNFERDFDRNAIDSLRNVSIPSYTDTAFIPTNNVVELNHLKRMAENLLFLFSQCSYRYQSKEYCQPREMDRYFDSRPGFDYNGGQRPKSCRGRENNIIPTSTMSKGRKMDRKSEERRQRKQSPTVRSTVHRARAHGSRDVMSEESRDRRVYR